MKKWLLFCIVCLLYSSSALAQTNEKDSLALVDFFTSTNGVQWVHKNNWLTQKPVSKWYGVTVTHNRVTSLRLAGNGLSGSLPASFGNLSRLAEVVLPYNQIGGTLPASIGRLTEVTDLDISYNQLMGEIPESIRGMKSLLYLSLNSNHLTQTTNTDPMLKRNALQSGDIGYNNFTFDGVEFLAREVRVYYSPQAMIHLQQSGNHLFVHAGGTLSNNTYYWYKVGESRYATIRGDSAFAPPQTGLYYAKIRNRIAGNLQLITDTIAYQSDASFITARQATAVTVTGTNSADFIITPNPANGKVTIHTKSRTDVALLSASGALLRTMIVNATATLPLSDLPDGMYFLQNKSTGAVHKLVVHH